LISNSTVLTLNIISGLISVLTISFLRFKPDLKELMGNLFWWFFIRLTSDFVSITLDLKYHENPIPVYHISTFLETILMIRLFVQLKNSSNWTIMKLAVLPFIALILDVVILGSIFEISIYGHVLSFALTSLLLFSLIYQNKSLNYRILSILRSLFIFHAILLVYALFQNVIRSNIEIFKFCYPLFLFTNVSMNLYPTYLLWSMRKN
jgi:hypothetical protein